MLIGFWISFFTLSVKAAPCCAGSAALPSLITGDEARVLNLSLSYSDVIGDAPAQGKGLPVFRDQYSVREVRKSFQLGFASLISDRWQVGAFLPVIQNDLSSTALQESHTQLGDISSTVAFETLPEYEYSLWKPRIYSFLQWVVPTGRSIRNSQTRLASDVSGLGYHQLHFGSLLIKRWSDWDANFVFKIGRDLNFNGTLLNSSLGLGYSFAERWRLGTSLETSSVSPQVIDQIKTASKLVWNTSATLTFLMGSESSLILGYVDQTLIGPAFNTTLARAGSLSLQHRFER